MNALNLKLLTTGVAAGIALTGPVWPVSASTGYEPAGHAGVCSGIDRCRRTAVIDVDGDRRADRIGWRRLDRGHVQIRVRTTDHGLLTRTVDVRRWRSGEWAGATRVDGRPGAELVIGSKRDGDTPYYTMLTHRGGRLVVERSPAHPQGRLWTVDAGLMGYAGWHRHVWPAGRITMTLKVARRDGDSVAFRGYTVRYEWRDGDWRQARRVRAQYPTTRRAEKIAGWYVGRLDRFPAIDRDRRG
ncbi:MAG: hypothetical protein ACRDO7_10030 [Nocardioidaceae bacterium]